MTGERITGRLDQVASAIVGRTIAAAVLEDGEFGLSRRPMELVWLESIAWQCRETRTPLYIKQDSAPRDGQQGRIPAELWAIKEFPDISIGA